ncbi:LysR family transcriptional regulator [Acidovorax sp. GBBC 3334]|uniref:LysR family transcriptional regulator n=1 Tax=unclassified Acidovorax TaxID=2684926 RepID=UPI002304BEA9|nr:MULTISPECIES: LysR family transcriptional regulator [unclassified Acidovorax]MDA8453242.1 LysR family transcriptional regulator [Acidovorax sp. GBBC 3334]MDA8520650.1 LysR family transcriptional regulator [Acidovorax sp. NCPPB 4044]
MADLMAFAVIAEERSFTRAANRLGITSSALSHAMRLLEERLDVKLLSRTTRSVAPTAAGERLLARVQPAIREIGDGLEALASEHSGPCGRVRINSHRSGAVLYVMPKLQALRREYPGITLDITTEEGLVDIVSAGYDAGIRNGERLAQDMVAVRISPDYRTAVVAAPKYLKAAPAIERPQDLVQHSCLSYRMSTSGAMLRWQFQRGTRTFDVAINPTFITNDMDLMIGAALAGTGVGYLLREQVAEHLASGKLVELLPKWSMRYEGTFLYYPSRRQMRPALRAVIDMLRHDGQA